MSGSIYFEIQADEPERAALFYQSVFNWKFARAGDLPIEYWRIEAGRSRGGLLKRPASAPPPECGTNAFVCSFEVDDFDQTAAKIIKASGQIALPKFAVPNTCWQGYFLDTEGNTFGLFQPDPQAQ